MNDSTSPAKMQRPLAGVKVIDFGQYIAGPLTAMLLADQGAEVIRIEPPDGPFHDTPANEIYNRGKQIISLNLKNDDDKLKALSLVGSADVLVENFRPGVLTRLGLGPEKVCELNQKLIYLSLPGFSASDKERSHIQAWEGVIAAFTGLYTDVSFTREICGDPPIYTALPMASVYGAAHAVGAVTMALFAREKDGLGDYIEVPLASSLLSAFGTMGIEVENLPKRYSNSFFKDREKKIINDTDELWSELKRYAAPLYANYRCADNRLYLMCSDGHLKMTKAALKALG